MQHGKLENAFRLMMSSDYAWILGKISPPDEW